MRRSALLAVVVTMAACSDATPPLAPTPVAGPTPAAPVAAVPTAVPGVLSLALPIADGDSATTAFGIAPFGYHGADHALDGHPGWDIEYRPGASVRAAAAGTVQSVLPDSTGRTVVQIQHVVGSHYYRTVYTNLQTVASDVAPNLTVQSGQVLGVAGLVTTSVGTTAVTYAMTHFQLDDFEYYRDVPNPNAVSPEPFLSAGASSLFVRIWSNAAFVHELVEPFVSNPRALTFPASRTWMKAGGDAPAGVQFSRASARAADYTYALLAESGVALESGTVTLNVAARPYPTIDLVSATATRRGIYDIVSNEMRLAIGEAGAARPTTISAASIYRTTP